MCMSAYICAYAYPDSVSELYENNYLRASSFARKLLRTSILLGMSIEP